MASFPNLPLDEDNIKVKYLEPFGSEAINKKDLDMPLGVYSGFIPSVTGGSAVLSLFADFTKGRSVLRMDSSSSQNMLTVVLETNIELDFTGHDFATNSPVYVVATGNYQVGVSTTANIVTTLTPPDGITEIGICRVQSPTNDPLDMEIFASDVPDRHQPLATANNPYGFMLGGSAELLVTLNSLKGKIPYNSTIKSSTTVLSSSDIDQIHMFNMSGIIANQNIALPDSTGLTDGCRVGFLSLTGLPPGFTLTISPQGSDVIMSEAVPSVLPVPRAKKHVGHFFIYSLVTAATSGLPTDRWYLTVNTLPELHAVDHQSGGSDPLALDTLAATTDNTNLDATISAHGLLPKLSNVAAEFLNGLGAWAIPGGAVSGGSSYIFNTPALSGTSHNLLADGNVSILNPPGGSGVVSYNLPNAGTETLGAVVRCVFLQDAAVAPNNAAFLSVSGQFVWNGGLVNGNFLPGLTSDWRRGQFLEFTLQNFTGGNLWVCTANTQVDEHNLRHADGGQDELDVSTLGGFPGTLTSVLRGNGTFGPAMTHFANLKADFAAGAGVTPTDATIGQIMSLRIREDSGNTPVTLRDSNHAGGTSAHPDTVVEIAQAGLYFIGMSFQSGAISGVTSSRYTIRQGFQSIGPRVLSQGLAMSFANIDSAGIVDFRIQRFVTNDYFRVEVLGNHGLQDPDATDNHGNNIVLIRIGD